MRAAAPRAVLAVHAALASAGAWAGLARELGPADILFNNATPASGMARLEKMTPEAMDEHLRVNYHGAFTAMQAVFLAMKERGYGRIINMCSLNGINA
ncbi:MAG: SDR family NAD(P)-dependent oxidoreductase, partial [Gemmobacter sp.]